jgi:hypothetical protein
VVNRNSASDYTSASFVYVPLVNCEGEPDVSSHHMARKDFSGPYSLRKEIEVVFFFSDRLGCFGSLLISAFVTAGLLFMLGVFGGDKFHATQTSLHL